MKLRAVTSRLLRPPEIGAWPKTRPPAKHAALALHDKRGVRYAATSFGHSCMKVRAVTSTLLRLIPRIRGLAKKQAPPGIASSADPANQTQRQQLIDHVLSKVRMQLRAVTSRLLRPPGSGAWPISKTPPA